jgi:hypothetical protein
MALEQGGKIYPQYATKFENSFLPAWPKIKYSQSAQRPIQAIHEQVKKPV